MRLLSTLLTLGIDLAFALFLLYSFTLLGHRVRITLPKMEWSPSVAVLWDAYLGITVAAVITTILGMTGLFNPIVFIGLVAAGPLITLPNRHDFLSPIQACRNVFSIVHNQRWAALGLGITAVVTFVPAAAPEIFYDALYYHLGLQQQYLLTGKIQLLPDAVHSAFPAYLDVLFGLCLGIVGSGAAKFFNLLLFFLAWGATAAFLYEVIGQLRPALAGTLTVASVPGAVVMSTMCAIDSSLMGFSAMSALAIARMRHVPATSPLGVIALGASTAGFVAGSKYTGLWLLAVLASAILAGGRIRQTVRTAVLFCAIAILIAAPWYGRNFLLTGDPLYPAIRGFMGDAEAHWAVERLHRDVQPIGLRWTAPAELVIALERTPERLGAGAEPGWLLPLGAFALVIGSVRCSHLRPWALAVCLYVPIWMSMTGVVRYLYPLFPLCALGTAWTTSAILARWRNSRWALGVVVFLAVAPLWQSIVVLDALYVGADVAALLSGSLSRDEYLTRRLAYYPAAQWLNAHTDVDAHIFYLGETRLLYLDRRVTFSSAYDVGSLNRLLSPLAPALSTSLESRGITHLLVHGREIDRLRNSYDYLSLSPDAEHHLRMTLQGCRIVFRKSGVQICELSSQEVS